MKNANWQTEGNQILIQYWRYKLLGGAGAARDSDWGGGGGGGIVGIGTLHCQPALYAEFHLI